MKANNKVLVADLFCGCGGLSLGFDLYDGGVQYETVLAIDNETSPVRVFNDNHVTDSKLKKGRKVDVTWFSHPSEIVLFYLNHLSIVAKRTDVASFLEETGFLSFLGQLKRVDEEYSAKIKVLGSTETYLEAFSSIEPKAFNIALSKKFLRNISLSSLKKCDFADESCIWTEEYSSLGVESEAFNWEVKSDILESCKARWEHFVNELRQASKKKGKGINKNNAQRIESICDFLLTPSGVQLRDLWIEWQSKRKSLRSGFCLENYERFQTIYKNNRLQVMLGGPPCKGFSRIGRPVIASLREQGVHAWSHYDFGDERNALMIQYVLFLEALQPDAFVFENVSNFKSELKTPGGKLNAPEMLMELIEALSEGNLFYHIHHELVNSRHFAVPQDRRRFIMVGFNARKIDINIKRDFFTYKESPDVNLKHALWGLSDPLEFSPANKTKTSDCCSVYRMDSVGMPDHLKRFYDWIQKGSSLECDAHVFRKLRADDLSFLFFVAPGIRWMDLKTNGTTTLNELERCVDALAEGRESEELKKAKSLLNGNLMLRLILEHGMNRFKLDEQHLLMPNYLKNGGSTHGDWFERLSGTKPCKTIVAHIGKDTYGYFHPFEQRAITIREAARIQSFPDSYKFGSVGVVDGYSVIGNAVPPLLSNYFAQKIDEINKKTKIFSVEARPNFDKPQKKPIQLPLCN